MPDLRVVVAGAGGRMGAANVRAVVTTPGLVLHAAFDRPGSPAIGRDAGEIAGAGTLGVTIGDNAEAALDGAEILIDFTAPAVSVLLAELAAPRGLVHIVGTTGCSREEDWAIQKAGSAGARIVKSGNFSLGINMLMGLVRQAARALPGYDIEVLEMHHNKKVDAPSGTALMLGRAAAEGRGIDLDQHAVKVRDGHTGPRQEGSIGFATLRGGGVIGEHSVILAGDTERITLSHSAQDRGMFAAGAVQAALWAASQPPGFYSMADVLGFSPPTTTYVDNDDNEFRPLSGIGIALAAGGGASGFVSQTLRDTTDVGGDWDVRATIGTRSPLAFEASYIGSAQGINALGLDSDAVLVGNGAQGALRLNGTINLPFQPFVFAGIGWRRYDLTNTDTNTSDIQGSDDVLEVPMGLGIAGKWNGLILDARGEFRATSDEDLLPRINTNETDDAHADMQRWGVKATVGAEF